MPDKILLLGGTKEAAALAERFVTEGHDVITSLAGRTKEPKPVAGKLRIGGFGGPGGLASFMEENAINRLVDATHPFATNISINARQAAKYCGINLEVHERPPWQQHPEDHWIVVSSLGDAMVAIPGNARVLLALGSQHIDGFAGRDDVHYIVRMVDPPRDTLPLPRYELVLGKPSADWQQEADLLAQYRISHIVCRNSGGTGAYAKIEAARHLGLPVIILGRDSCA